MMMGQSSDVDVSKNLINVRRKHVFSDGIKKLGRSKFQASLPLSVKFADELGFSEGAVDLGGPTREFLRLAVHDAFLSNAFGGPADRKVLVLNQEGIGLLVVLCKRTVFLKRVQIAAISEFGRPDKFVSSTCRHVCEFIIFVLTIFLSKEKQFILFMW